VNYQNRTPNLRALKEIEHRDFPATRYIFFWFSGSVHVWIRGFVATSAIPSKADKIDAPGVGYGCPLSAYSVEKLFGQKTNANESALLFVFTN
jgi:hypothetical protein